MPYCNQNSRLSRSATLFFTALAITFISACQFEVGPVNVGLRTSSIIDQPVADPDYTETIHPFVLVHGLNGFDSIFGMDYFHHVPRALEVGGAVVFTPKMSSLNSNEVRGEQLIIYLDDQIAIDPSISQFNLIAHSHGAQTARYVAAVRPDIIASVTTVGGVNKLGSEKAQIITDAYQSIWGTAVVDVSFTLMAWLFDNLSDTQGGLPQYPRAAFAAVDYKGTEAFNLLYPDAIPADCVANPNQTIVNGVAYYSWGGIGVKTNKLDPLDKILEATMDKFPDDQNDGTLSTCATHLGMVIKDDHSPMNHTDLTNQALGLIHPKAPYPLTLYRIHANLLKQHGL